MEKDLTQHIASCHSDNPPHFQTVKRFTTSTVISNNNKIQQTKYNQGCYVLKQGLLFPAHINRRGKW